MPGASASLKGAQAYRLTTRVSADYRHDEVDVVYGVDTGKAYIPDIFVAEDLALGLGVSRGKSAGPLEGVLRTLQGPSNFWENPYIDKPHTAVAASRDFPGVCDGEYLPRRPRVGHADGLIAHWLIDMMSRVVHGALRT